METWSLPGLLAVVAEALVLVLAALVLLPDVDGSSPLGLRSHYFEQSRPYFLLGALLIAQLAHRRSLGRRAARLSPGEGVSRSGHALGGPGRGSSQ